MKLFNLPVVLALSALAFVQLVDAKLKKFDGSSPVASEYDGGEDFKSQPRANIDNDNIDDFDGAYETKLDDTDAEPEDLRPSRLQNTIPENDEPEEGLNGSLSGMGDEQFPSDLYNDGNGTSEMDDIDPVSDTELSPSIDDENPAFYGASDNETAFGSNDDFNSGLTQDSFKTEKQNSISGNMGNHPIPSPLAPAHPAATLPNEPVKSSGLRKPSSDKAPLVQQAQSPATEKQNSNAKQGKLLKKVKVALPAKSHAPAHKAQGKESKKPKKPAGKPVTLNKPTGNKPVNKKGEKKAAKKAKGGDPKASKKAKAGAKAKGKAMPKSKHL